MSSEPDPIEVIEKWRDEMLCRSKRPTKHIPMPMPRPLIEAYSRAYPDANTDFLFVPIVGTFDIQREEED